MGRKFNFFLLQDSNDLATGNMFDIILKSSINLEDAAIL